MRINAIKAYKTLTMVSAPTPGAPIVTGHWKPPMGPLSVEEGGCSSKETSLLTASIP